MKTRIRQESAPYGGIDEALINVAVDAQKDVFDWFCKLPGFGDQFDIRMTPNHVMGLDYAHCISGGRGGLGRYVVIRLKQRIEELGIAVYTNCEATELLLDTQGKDFRWFVQKTRLAPWKYSVTQLCWHPVALSAIKK